MGEHEFKNTISRAAVDAGLPRITEFRGRNPPPEIRHAVAVTLDQAIEQARVGGGIQEILDTHNPEEETYLVKLARDGWRIIGVLGRESKTRSGYAWAGMSGMILITVCSYYEANKSFVDGRWKSIDGKPVLAQEDAVEAKLHACTKCGVQTPPDGFYKHADTGKRFTQCKECIKTRTRNYHRSKQAPKAATHTPSRKKSATPGRDQLLDQASAAIEGGAGLEALRSAIQVEIVKRDVLVHARQEYEAAVASVADVITRLGGTLGPAAAL